MNKFHTKNIAFKKMFRLKTKSLLKYASLTPSRRVYYIFSGPPNGIIFSENSEKISSH